MWDILCAFLASVEPEAYAGVLGIVITAWLFFLEARIQKLNEKIMEFVAHMGQFTSSQNTMAELRHHELPPSIQMMRSAYVSYFTLLNESKGPTQEIVNAINNESDYLSLISTNGVPNISALQLAYAKPHKRKSFLEILQLTLFIFLLVTQFFGLYFSQ